MELDNALLTHAESSMHMACALSAIPTSIKFCTLKITDVWKFVQKDTAFKREDVNSHALRIYFQMESHVKNAQEIVNFAQVKESVLSARKGKYAT